MARSRSKRIGVTLLGALLACSVASPAAAQNENASAVKAKQPYEVRVFYLLYAKVSDQRITEDGHQFILPGVVSNLRAIMGLSKSDASKDENVPRIEADEKNNAVIVRDVPASMPTYEALIAAIDIPTRPQSHSESRNQNRAQVRMLEAVSQ